jgi:predicted O-methyltransferase YrrM
MNRNNLLALLAATATMLPGAVMAVLGIPASFVVIVAIGGAVAVIVALNRRWYRQIITRIDLQATHVRGAVGIAATAGDLPIFWSEHAIAPETLVLIQHTISSLSATRVLELGSGVSTLLIAKSFRRAGEGHVLSFDDDERWASLTNTSLKREKLEAFAEVRVAPLVDITSGGRQASWYNLADLDDSARFDLIIVDGPPAWRGDSLARLPALYELRRHLSDNGLLVLDDAARGGETEIARQWQRDFPDLHFRMVGVGRGLFVASVQRSSLDLLPA